MSFFESTEEECCGSVENVSKTPSIHSLNALGVRAKNIKLAKKQELIRNITRNIGKKEKRVECGHNEKEALSRPITRSVTASRPKSVTIIAETSSLKLRNCEKCDWGPLDFSHVADEIQRDPVYLHVLCKKCGHHNVINLQGENDNDNVGARPGSHKNMLARRAALGCLHQGLGHSQYEGLMAAMNIKPVSENTMKQAEREVGILIEETAKESCEKWRREEKRRGEGEGLKGSFDAGWQKQGRAHNSRTGHGTTVGLETGKCLDYGTKNTYCRKCLEAEKRGVQPKPHDCRLNHTGSAKAMEASIAVDLCHKEKYQVLIGDDDSTVIARVREEVDSNLEKWSDVNHATCTLTKGLFEGKGMDFGPDNDRINDSIIDHIKTCFSYALHQNKNNVAGIIEGIGAIVPHSFGDHSKCGFWCKHSKDPEGYRHSTLPGGRNLRGEKLRKFFNSLLQPFIREDVAKKLASLGSTQRNECISSVVGTKNPKKRFYGGSESSDYRVSASVAQFNEGHEYLKAVEKKIGGVEGKTLNVYVTKMQRKRKQSADRKQEGSAKKRRRELKRKRKHNQKNRERREGTTYCSGIGFRAVTQEQLNAMSVSGEDVKVEKHLKDNNTQPFKKPSKPVNNRRKPDDYVVLIYDLETTGFKKDAEITQLACIDLKGEREYSTYILPKRIIDPGASKTTGLSIGYLQGVRCLCKDGKAVEAPDRGTALNGFIQFLKSLGNKPKLLVAHNGQSFDAPRLVGNIEEQQIAHEFNNDIFFADSLIASRKQFKRKERLKLQDIYFEAFKEEFTAHDALEDCRALRAVLINHGKPLQELLYQTATPFSHYSATRQYQARLKSVKETYKGRLSSTRVINRLSNFGITFTLLRDIYVSCGRDALISFIAGKCKGRVRVTKDIGDLCEILKALF